MIIHDKGLLRCMQGAYSGKGYRVAGARDEGSGEPLLIICTESWVVKIVREYCPKAVLPKIVLHAGELPRLGEAMLVRKKEIQTMLWDEAMAPWLGASKLAAENKIPAQMKWTGFTWKGLELWQNPDNNRIWMMDAAFTDVAAAGVTGWARQLGDKLLHWKGMASELFVARVSPGTELGYQAVDKLEECLWLEESE